MSGTPSSDITGYPLPETHFGVTFSAVTKSGDDSRRVVYFSLLLGFFCLFAIRQPAFPRWEHLRYEAMDTYERCPQFPVDGHTVQLTGLAIDKAPITLENVPPSAPPYPTIDDRMKVANSELDRLKTTSDSEKGKYDTARNDPNTPRTNFDAVEKAYKDAETKFDAYNSVLKRCQDLALGFNIAKLQAPIFDFRKKDVMRLDDEDESIPIPLVGAKVDSNDVWIFVGPITCVVYLVLIFTLRSDEEAIRTATRLFPEKEGPERSLLRSTRVLGQQAEPPAWLDITARHSVMRFVLTVFPLMNVSLLALVDFNPWADGNLGTTPLLTGSEGVKHYIGWFELGLEAFSFILVFYGVFLFRQTFDSLKKTSDDL